MNLISAITNDANQSMRIVLDDGSKVDFSLSYKSGQQGWFFSITYAGFSIKNRRMVNSPNLLRNFKNILPFGLACTVSDNLEPIYQDDFSSQRVLLYVLNESDLVTVESTIIPRYSNA
jgi:hypothetical protein